MWFDCQLNLFCCSLNLKFASTPLPWNFRSMDHLPVAFSYRAQAALKHSVCNLIKKETPTQMFSCEFYKVFQYIFFTEHLRVTGPVLYLFLQVWYKKAFWMILQYFRNFSCKLSLEIVWFSQSLSVYYLKILKSPQCDRQSEALQRCLKICPLSKRPPCCFQHIPKILEKRPIYPDYFFFVWYILTHFFVLLTLKYSLFCVRFS